MTRTLTLVLESLEERHPGLTKNIAGTLYEAAAVCLDRHHTSPVVIEVKRKSESREAHASWDAPDQRTKMAWANTTDTTETGAYGIAIATVEVTDGLVAIARAETRTGADYYLGPAHKTHEDLEGTLRLEVSGIDQSNPAALRTRLAQKVRQCQKGESVLPAIAVVVGFSSLTVVTADVEIE
jgi:hypothetical protein